MQVICVSYSPWACMHCMVLPLLHVVVILCIARASFGTGYFSVSPTFRPVERTAHIAQIFTLSACQCLEVLSLRLPVAVGTARSQMGEREQNVQIHS
jgi:hypothetical protein